MANLSSAVRFVLKWIAIGLTGLIVALTIARLAIGVYNERLYGARNRDEVSIRPSQTYYIAVDGEDSNSGHSPADAWRSLSRANEVQFAPGDSLLLEGGEEFAGSLLFDSKDVGTATRPVTITSFGGSRAIIKAAHGDGIRVHNTAGFRISDLNIVGSGMDRNEGDGIHFLVDLLGKVKLEYVRIERVEVSGFGKHGIRVDANKPILIDFITLQQSGFRDVRIADAVAHHNAVAGIYVYGEFNPFRPVLAHEDVSIQRSTAHSNPGLPGPKLPNTGSGIVLSGVDGGLIEHSLAYGNGWRCESRQGGPVGIWAWDANEVVIQFNESHSNRTGGRKDGGGFDLDGSVQNSILQYNYSHDNDGAGLFLAQFAGAHRSVGNTVRYNVSQNDGRKNGYAGLQVWAAEGEVIEDALIYNNSVYVEPSGSLPASALLVRPSTAAGIRLSNNVFIAEDGLPVLVVKGEQPDLRLEGNAYYSIGAPLRIEWQDRLFGDLAGWRAASGQEELDGAPVGFAGDLFLQTPGEGSTLGDPRRLSDLTAYRLTPESPLIDAGLDLQALFGIDPGDRDFFGGPIPSGRSFDIGAHEFR